MKMVIGTRLGELGIGSTSGYHYNNSRQWTLSTWHFHKENARQWQGMEDLAFSHEKWPIFVLQVCFGVLVVVRRLQNPFDYYAFFGQFFKAIMAWEWTFDTFWQAWLSNL